MRLVSSERDRRAPFAAVRNTLNRHDPEGLLEAGALSDEYEPEADDIAARLRDGQPVTSEVLAEVWERWFGPNSYAVTKTPQQLAVLAVDLDALR